jgi:spore germination protein GerM
VYWLDNVNNSIELVPSTVSLDEDTENEQEILNEAFDRLLAGPSDSDYASSIPEETELRDISVKADGVHVDLSEDFTFGGGSASMMGRVAQILYTATSLDPDAQVWLEIEGEPLEVLGGEGLLIDQPLTRQSFEKNFEL